MKVYGVSTGAISGADGLASRLGKNRAQSGGDAVRTGDAAGTEVRVSKEAMKLAARPPAGFDIARVERLRDAHTNDDFHVDSAVIARRLSEEN